MAQPSGNLVQPQGLVPLSPFLGGTTQKTGGTTTPLVGGATSSNNIGGIAFGSGSQAPVPTTSSINFGGLITPPSGNTQTTPTNNSTATSLAAIPGENYQQYEARVGGLNNQGNQQTTPSNQNTGTVSGLMPTPSASPASPQNQNPYTSSAPAFSGLVGALGSTASQPSQAFLDAQKQAQQANQGLQESRTNEANALAANSSNPIPLEFQQGRGQVLQNQYLGQQNALAQEYSGAVGLENAATGQQGTQQSGLAGAAGLAAPQSANPYGTYSPTTGQYSQYGGGNGGGASTAGGVQAQVQQGAQIQTMTGQQKQAQSLASNLNQLITSANINPNDIGALTTFANGINQWINNQSGDPQYQNAANLINEISSRYASILNQAGGTPTDQSTISHSIINGLASGQSIQTVLQSLDKNASDSINALKGASQGNANNQNSGGGTTFGSFF